MKKISLLRFATILMLLNSCSSDDTPVNSNDGVISSISVTIEDADFSGITRSSYIVDPERGFISSWTEGDVIGIYPIGGDQVAFPISQGEGSATAYFDGGSWALRSNFKYSAYYPFNKGNYMVSETALPVSYIGQTQNGNNNTSGLGAFDYLAAPATQPDKNGAVNLMMKHLGCFVRFQLTMPEGTKLLKANVASNGTPFITTGTVDLSATAPSITANKTASNFFLDLTDIACVENEVVTLFAMVAPANLSSSKLTIMLLGDNHKTYIYECYGANFTAGKSYNFSIAEARIDEGTVFPDSGDDNGESGEGYTGVENGHEYVDLGTTVKWATCNIGANAPQEYGYKFAWGETESKDEFKWENYEWIERDAHNINADAWKYLTKYRVKSSTLHEADNKTILELEDDAAHVNWGGNWRMPMKEEIDDLMHDFYWVYTDSYKGTGIEGFIVYKPKYSSHKGVVVGHGGTPSYLYTLADIHIFIPKDNSTMGGYWSSTLSNSTEVCAWHFGMSIYNPSFSNQTSRYYGAHIRPVCQ